MQENNSHNRQELKKTLLERIDQEKLQPRSRLFFRSRECVVWLLWLMSIAVGGLAVAISVFVVMHHQYALYEATHANLLTFLVDILPLLWLLVFAAMAYFALYNIRHTKHGYRYSITTILASSIVLSFALGSALQFFGLGHAVDSLLGKQMDMYISQEKFESALWQQPESGRLIGAYTLKTTAPEKFVIFEDIAGGRWRLDVIELVPADKALLVNANQVRVLGEVIDSKARLFRACNVFAWMFNENLTRHDRSEGRQTFLDRMSKAREQAQKRLAAYQSQAVATASASNTARQGGCSEIALGY